MPTQTPPREYVLGTHDDELARLGLQHRLWIEHASALWERAGLRPGQTVLDVGCGPGFATMDLATLVGPSGRVIAIDESERYVARLTDEAARLGLRNIDASVGDVQALDRMAVPAAGTVDAAYARWVLCFVQSPARVVAGVAKALRPGGVFMVQDYFNYEAATLAPRSQPFTRMIGATGEAWRARGGDPDIAGKLPALLDDAGFDVREIRPIVRVARPGSLLWQWPTSFWRIFAPRLVEMGLISPDEERAFFADWDARSRDPRTFFMTPPVWDIVAVKR